MMNISSNIVKRIGFSFAFLTLICVAVSAQDYSTEKKGEKGLKWSQALAELKDTLRKDSLLLSEYYGVQLGEIPNVYSSKVGGMGDSRMPIISLYGNSCAPMPGTEKLDKVESRKNLESRMKTRPLILR